MTQMVAGSMAPVPVVAQPGPRKASSRSVGLEYPVSRLTSLPGGLRNLPFPVPGPPNYSKYCPFISLFHVRRMAFCGYFGVLGGQPCRCRKSQTHDCRLRDVDPFCYRASLASSHDGDWVAVADLDLNHHNSETILSGIYPY